MKILMLSQSYPKCRGDRTAPFIESIATSVAARGCEVHMVLPEHPGLQRGAVEDGVHLHVFHYAPRPGWTGWGYSEALWGDVRIKRRNYLLAPLVLLSASRLIRRLTARERFDLVHAHWILPNGPIAALAAGGLPLVISLHGSDLFLAEKNRVWQSAAAWSLRRTAAVTGPSQDMLARAARLGARSSMLHLIPYGVDAQAFDAPRAAADAVRSQLGLGPADLLLLAPGRMVYKKGFGYLLDALPHTPAKVHLAFVGGGDLRAELEQRARELDVTGRVHFAGAVPHTQMPAYLAASDMVAVPSVRDAAGNVDGLPNTALEALAAGRPLVATRVAGLPDVVADGINGLLVEEKDASALATAISRLAGDAELRRRLGAAARERACAELSWERVADKFVGVYEKVLE